MKTEINKKIFILIFIIFILSISIFVFFSIDKEPKAHIKNLHKYSKINKIDQDFLERRLFLHLKNFLNIKKSPQDIFIRENSYQKTEFKNNKVSESFIIDIDSLKISYTIDYQTPIQKKSPYPIVINCPKKPDQKYQTKCQGIFNNSESIEKDSKFPILKHLPIKTKEYRIELKEYNPTKPKLKIITIVFKKDAYPNKFEFYKKENKNKALNKFKELKDDPNNYNIEYQNWDV